MNPHTKSVLAVYLIVLLSVISLGIYLRWLYNQSEEVYCQTATIAQMQDDNKYKECLR